MREIEGGSWIGDALRAVGRAAKTVGQAVASAAEWVYDHTVLKILPSGGTISL